MKKLYTLILSIVFALSATAATWPVSITDNVFNQPATPPSIGDVVVWTNNGANPHTATSGVVPSGAAAINSGTLNPSQTYSYTIVEPGTYGYGCVFHASTGMAATFTVAGSSIFDPSTTMGSLFYPNPCLSKITVVYEEGDQILVYDMLGNKVRTILLEATAGKMEIDLGTLPQGTYFFRILKEGEIVSINKIVKA